MSASEFQNPRVPASCPDCQNEKPEDRDASPSNAKCTKLIDLRKNILRIKTR